MIKSRMNAELVALEELCKTAWQFLQQTEVNEKRLKHNPWFLVIGSQQSGKTSFVQNAELSWLPAKHLTVTLENQSEQHKHCNWWFNSQATLLEVPGAYFTTKKTNLQQPINWQNFLCVAKKYFKQKRLNGIILTLSFPEWLSANKEQQQTITQQLRQNLLYLASAIKYPCPVYLILTKLDQVIGFNDFFADLGQEERRQTLGFSLSTQASEKLQNLPALFKKFYDQLLTRLHSRVIWRTHQERNQQKRVLIQQFPWQLESAKNSLSELFYQLNDVLSLHGKKPLQGIYCVSNKQQGEAINFLPKPLASHLSSLEPDPALASSKTSFAYFSQQLLTQTIFNNNDARFLESTDHKKWYTPIYFTAAGLIGLTCIYLAYSFNSKLLEINNAETTYIDYQLLAKQLPPVDNNLNQTLSALTALQQTVNHLSRAHLPLFIQDFHHSSTLLTLAQKNYHRELIHYFLPGIQTLLETTLNNTNDPNQLYSGLKIYLMLGDPSRFDSVAIKSWFEEYWKNATSTTQQTILEQHIDNLLANPIPPIVLNQQLLTKTRLMLNTLPAAQLTNVLLRNNTVNQALYLNNQIPQFAKVFAVNNSAATIPAIYTAKQFANIYFYQIPKACNIAINGDWVLGSTPHATPFNASPELLAQVRLQYLKDYAAYWHKLMFNLTISNWQTWQQVLTTFDALNSTRSPLIILLKTVTENTTLSNLIPLSFNLSSNDAQIIQANLTNQFQSYNNLLTAENNHYINTLNHITTSVEQLRHYLVPITDANNSDKAAYLAAKERLTNLTADDPINRLLTEAKNVPEPLHSWLNALADNVWRLLLNHTTEYLNQTWQDQVVTFYQDRLDNRYPLYKTSQQDISIGDFKEFFKPDGIINHYLSTQLSAFIDMSNAKWHCRELNGQSINLSPEVLAQLERANLIHSMFFANNNQLSVLFSLQAIAMEPDVKKLILNLDGKIIVDQQNDISTPHFINWPLSNKQTTATFTFLNNQGQQVSHSESGPWAIFRLLDDANIQLLNPGNTTTYQLLFDLNGNAARYRLIAGNVINPFIPGIIENFRCPQSLE